MGDDIRGARDDRARYVFLLFFFYSLFIHIVKSLFATMTMDGTLLDASPMRLLPQPGQR